MTCRELTEMLLEFVAGELGEEVAREVRKHLEACPPCDNIVRSYRVTIHVTRTLPPRPLPPGLVERVKEALGQSPGQRPA